MFHTPTEIIKANFTAEQTKAIIDTRYEHWWALKHVIPCGDDKILYFIHVEETPVAVAVRS